MPIEKFRRIEDMSDAPDRPARDGFERFVRLCARFWKISPRTYPRGVFRFRTQQEAQAARETVARGARRR